MRTESPPLSNFPRMRVKKHVRSDVEANTVGGFGEDQEPPFE
jgi:hypothetical protein